MAFSLQTQRAIFWSQQLLEAKQCLGDASEYDRNPVLRERIPVRPLYQPVIDRNGRRTRDGSAWGN